MSENEYIKNALKDLKEVLEKYDMELQTTFDEYKEKYNGLEVFIGCKRYFFKGLQIIDRKGIDESLKNLMKGEEYER